MSMRAQLPLIGVSTCVREIGPHPTHTAGEKYVAAAAFGAGGLVVLLPSLAGQYEFHDIVERLDGLLLTGSPSNIEPEAYRGSLSAPGTEHDPQRDATTLPLIRAALGAGLPLLAICRGIQELNVALGGTLHQNVHELPGKLDHRSRREDPIDVRYGPSHPVNLTAGGSLSDLAGATKIEVNSLHSQAIDRPADRLSIEGVAPDGVIEAVRVRECPAFALGVQWHPEWRFWDNPLSRAILEAFGEACRRHAALRESARPVRITM